ncbi:CapA family protein [Altererythrobacter sp. CC-YST694]|uniref:CapA family protein n=1 Tax=Altererythrobacter sp. CC-YST694 TaxID=2755038 RepID=UPI001D020147|nr:CapA family protein [Altererythrobacter sp. CC-YST694]
MFTGDLVLDEPDAGHWLAGIAPLLRDADMAIGHLEVPHTRSTFEYGGDVPAPGAPLENLAALAEAGFTAVSLAGNHIGDCGAEGISDTIAELDRLGIRHAGAGRTLGEARRAAMLSAKGRNVALLSYNCVGPEATWARHDRAGCAYLPLLTTDGSPVAPAAPLESIAPQAYEILANDIAAIRQEADFVIVALHKGIVHRPAVLAPYERPLARAAIDHGADLVIGHHAHIARGIEFHKGRPIFHGMGNGCVVTRALSPDQDHPLRRKWAQRRKALFGFEPDPDYPLAPFHPEAVNAFVGSVTLDAAGVVQTGIVPVFVEPPGRPVRADGTRAQTITRYMEDITTRAGLPPIHIAPDGQVLEEV